MDTKNIKLDKNVMKEMGVSFVLLFGSQVNGVSLHPGSDIDLAVVFKRGAKKKDPVELYGTLRDEFTKKFSSENIDVVYLEDAPLSLQNEAVQNGVLLYSEDEKDFFDFKEMAMKKYFDFKFVEDIFTNALIKTN